MSTALSVRLREQTKSLHTTAERSGVMGALLRGRCPRPSYVALLASLASIYEALESGLEANASHPAVAPLLVPGLARHHALLNDLRALSVGESASVVEGTSAGATYSTGDALPAPHAVATEYAAHLRSLATDDPPRLLAHAWLRYLGDLSGGQIVARVVRESLALPAEATTFYEFPALGDPHEAASAWRTALNEAPLDAATQERIVDEARDGFRRHIELFEGLTHCA